MSSGDEISEGEELHLVRSAPLDWIHVLAERLGTAGIACHVKSMDALRATDSRWGLFVRERDLGYARGVDREVLRAFVPDVPDDFDPERLDTSRCPACGDPVAEGAGECAGCGLALL